MILLRRERVDVRVKPAPVAAGRNGWTVSNAVRECVQRRAAMRRRSTRTHLSSHFSLRSALFICPAAFLMPLQRTRTSTLRLSSLSAL